MKDLSDAARILRITLALPPHNLGERAEYLATLFDRAAERFESPIERKFAVAMAVHLAKGVSCVPALLVPDWNAMREAAALFRQGDALSFLMPQAQIEDMRVDFLCVHWRSGRDALMTAIECDGHDFHERTREQARRDRSRDRRLQRLGYRVFRFTGSEIWADSLACAAQVGDLIRSALNPAAGGADG